VADNMNSKYQELAREAGLLVYNPDKMPTKLSVYTELLIRECIEINKQELSFTAFEKLLNRYQEHFGVQP
jgi:hypothetical protein